MSLPFFALRNTINLNFLGFINNDCCSLRSLIVALFPEFIYKCFNASQNPLSPYNAHSLVHAQSLECINNSPNVECCRSASSAATTETTCDLPLARHRLS